MPRSTPSLPVPHILPLLLALWACQPKEQADTALPDDIAALDFDGLTEWARPIDDYIATNADILGHEDFMAAIFDLAVYGDRLYLGYGDATLNLGRNTPIALRYWPSPEPDAVTSEFTTDEEQVDRYRVYDDLLMVPGVDATEDDLLGNVYTLQPEGWYKSRTVEYAWHVQDAGRVGDVLYACGSGGTMDDYNNSTVNAYLYRSDDFGLTFQIAQQVPHPAPPGDQRFTHLLTVAGQLYVFGYISEYDMISGSSITGFHASAVTDDGLSDIDGMPTFYVTDTHELSADVGLVFGVKVSSSLAWQVLRFGADGVSTPEVFSGYTPLDAQSLGDGRTLLMLLEGDTYPSDTDGPWTMHLGITTDGTDFTEILSQELASWPWSAAYWQRRLFLGLDDGSVWMAKGG